MEQELVVKQPEELTQDDFESKDLAEFCKEWLQKIDVENQFEEQRRHRKWAKNRAYYRGNQRGFWDKTKNAWSSVDLDNLNPVEQSVLAINNQFRPQVKTICKEYSRSQTRIRSTAMSDSQGAVNTSRFSDSLIRYYQSKLKPESFRQLEAKYLLLCGNAFEYTYYDTKKKGVNVIAPKIGKTKLDGYKKTICPLCSEETNEEICPNCQAPTETTEIEEQELEKGYLGEQTINTGELVLEIVDPLEIKVWAGAQNLEMSPYLRRKRVVREEFLMEAYPEFKPKAGNQMSESASQMYKFYDASNEKSRDDSRGLHEYDQLWLTPTCYLRKKLKNPIKLLNGKEIPAGTKYIDIFPDGMYSCFADKAVLGYDNESKEDHWIHIPFDNNVDGFWADGLEDAIQNQQILNEYNSLSVENVLYNASPKLVINPRLINPSTVTGRPKDMLLLNDNARSDAMPEQAFAQIQGMSLTNEAMLGIESTKRDMREQTGALVAFNGQGDPNITTATGMSIARDSAMALVSTALAVRAEKEIDWCWQVLKLIKHNWYDNKYRFILGKYNESEALAFKNSDIEEEIILNVEAGSWMPLTNTEKLQNLGAYMTAFGIEMGFLNPMIPDTVREYASQLYNIPFEFNEVAPDVRIAQRRLSRAKDALPAMMMAIKPTSTPQELQMFVEATTVTLANIMSVEEDIDDHPVFIREYTKWLKTDEGQSAEPILRQAVKTVISEHKQFMQMQVDAQRMMNPPEADQNKETGKTFQPQEPAENPFQPPTNQQKSVDFSRNPNKGAY